MDRHEHEDFDPLDAALVELLGSGVTHERAAALAGCSTKTIQRRRRDARFEAAVVARRRQRLGEISGMLINAGDAAVVALLDALSSRDRVPAARTLLQLGGVYHRQHVTEQDFLDRLERLEQREELSSEDAESIGPQRPDAST